MKSEREQAPSGSRMPWLWHSLRAAHRRLRPAFLLVAFWGAIFLPWVVLSLLFTGIPADEPWLFTGVVIMNLAAAVVGGKYERGL